MSLADHRGTAWAFNRLMKAVAEDIAQGRRKGADIRWSQSLSASEPEHETQSSPSLDQAETNFTPKTYAVGSVLGVEKLRLLPLTEYFASLDEKEH